MPFALAQRNSVRSTAPKALAPVKLARTNARPIAVPSGVGIVQPQSVTDGTLLSYDVRPAPFLPRLSQVPQKSSGAAATHVIPVLRPPKAPQIVLYDQYNNNGPNGSLSATFTDLPDFSADLADDFVVPGGETWNVESIDADGIYFNGPGSATDWNVFIYANNSGFPGAQVYSTTNQPVVQNGTTFTVTLTPPAVLTAGTYWIEIQANMTFGTQGEWGWTDRTVQANQGAAFRNFGGGFGCGTDWVRKPVCVPTASGPDQVYRINGTTGGGGSPTPTPTGTPATCGTYNFSTGSDPIVPGTRDVGNHTDDGDTAVSLPFSFQLYDQTFDSVNVSSNGRLDFVCVNEPNGFLSACLPAPPNVCPFDYTIFAPWSDYRTDIIGEGCANFASGCGIFTSVSGSAPNRIFNIEWRAVYFADHNATANFEVRLYENDPNHRFDIIFGTIQPGSDQLYVSGVQGPNNTFTQDFCDGPPAAGSRTYTCAGGGGSPTPTPTGTPGCTVDGSLDDNDPTQIDRLFRSGIPQTCPASTTCAIFGDPFPRHYDAYTFTNNTGASQCVTVDPTTQCVGTNYIFVAAYLSSFDPNNICANWIGDSGSSPDPAQPPVTFQFNVDNGQTFVVVVSEVTPGGGCPAYTFTVAPESICGGSPTPTATPTATETPTATPTATFTATATATPTATATTTASATATATPTATATATASGTPTPRPTPTPRIAPTPRPRPTPAPR